MAVAVAAVLVAQAVNGGTSCEWWHPLGKVAAVLVAHAVAERVVVALLAPVVSMPLATGMPTAFMFKVSVAISVSQSCIKQACS